VVYIEISENEEGQRLDRFLRKYLGAAPLSFIYKAIRKDIKVNGKRASQELILQTGDRIDLYISEEQFIKLTGRAGKTTKGTADGISKTGGLRTSSATAKKEFTTVYEDENIVIVNKPFGLLTHGDGVEKKHHLSNQVVDDLIARGEFDPRASKGFTPAPANRLDRNTTGIVLFGKTPKALRDLNRRIRRRDGIKKFYLTIVAGELDDRLELADALIKDEDRNIVTIVAGGESPDASEDAMCDARNKEGVRDIVTVAEPIKVADGYTLIEVELVTGRSHQIRAHLASAGYPLIGDPKYGDEQVNEECRKALGLNGQILHAWRIEFSELDDSPLNYLGGETFSAEIPKRFAEIVKGIFGENILSEIRSEK